MGKYRIEEISRNNEQDYSEWKQLLKEARGQTLFHDPDFLAYHGDKFNENHLGLYKGQELCGIFPMALTEKDGQLTASSPYGGSYGGFIFKFTPKYSHAKEISKHLIDYLEEAQVDKAVITPPLDIIYEEKSDTFTFTLLEEGFELINADVSSVVPLPENGDIEYECLTSSARNHVRNAKDEGIEIEKQGNIEDFWVVLKKTFEQHGVAATHTLEEFKDLNARLPEKVYVDIGWYESKPVAGIGYLVMNSRVISSFYLMSDPKYRDTQALSFLILESLRDAEENGFKYYDMGTSSVDMQARPNIFSFKQNLGAIGKFRRRYSLDFNN